MAWTLQDIEKLQAAGKIKSFKATGNQSTGTAVKPSKKEREGISFIKAVLDSNKIPYIPELKFADNRKFRFDIAIPFYKVAVEYEGLGYKKTGHTTSEGYTSNCEKYNLATSLGWKVYRYTYKNYKNFENDFKTIING